MTYSAKTGLSAGAGAFAGAALANFFSGNKAQAAGEQILLDDATRNAIMSIMQDVQNMGQVITLLQAISNAIGESPDLENSPNWMGFTVIVQTALAPGQLPAYQVPYKKKVALTALTTNAGTIYLSNVPNGFGSAATRYPLVAGQALNLEISNTQIIYFTGTVANDGIEVAIEQG